MPAPRTGRPQGPVDCKLNATAPALLMVLTGRASAVKAALRGDVLGPRPPALAGPRAARAVPGAVTHGSAPSGPYREFGSELPR